MCAAGIAVLNGRSESETDGLSAEEVRSVVEFYKRAVDPSPSPYLTSIRECNMVVSTLTISDRHTSMMLEAGIIDILPDSWAYKSHGSHAGNPKRAKAIAVSLSETNACVCLALARIFNRDKTVERRKTIMMKQ